MKKRQIAFKSYDRNRVTIIFSDAPRGGKFKF